MPRLSRNKDRFSACIAAFETHLLFPDQKVIDTPTPDGHTMDCVFDNATVTFQIPMGCLPESPYVADLQM